MPEQATIGSLGDLAKMPGSFSDTVLRKLIRENPDFPVIEGGTKGKPYKIDLAAAMEWLAAHRGKKVEAERARAAEVHKLSVNLLGPDAAADVGQVGMSSAERLALLEEETAAIRLRALRGEFVRKSSVEDGIAMILGQLNHALRGLSARLGKRSQLSRKQQALIDEMLDQELNKLADKLEKLGRTGAISDVNPAL